MKLFAVSFINLKLAAIVIILTFVAISSSYVGELETKPALCSVVEARAFGFIKCRYRPVTKQWRLTYQPLVYTKVVDSGEYNALLRTLCEANGDTIHETIREIFKGRSREISCEFKKHSIFADAGR